MYQPLPAFAPLFPSLAWWRIFFNHRIEVNGSLQAAISVSNSKCGLKSREWMRFRIAGDRRLAIPIEGGASVLKNRHPESWMLSKSAVREIRRINSTLATAYGRTPYFHLLKDILLPDITVSGEGTGNNFGIKAEQLCTYAFDSIVEILDLDDECLLSQIKENIATGDNRLKSQSERIRMLADREYTDMSESVPPGFSVLDAVFRFGKDAIFALIPPF